jgi:hypothetical protein
MGPRLICGPSLKETSVCGTYLYRGEKTKPTTWQVSFINGRFAGREKCSRRNYVNVGILQNFVNISTEREITPLVFGQTG